MYKMYGVVPWTVRAIFQHYIGWFSGQAEHLNSLGTHKRALVSYDDAGIIFWLLENGRACWRFA